MGSFTVVLAPAQSLSLPLSLGERDLSIVTGRDTLSSVTSHFDVRTSLAEDTGREPGARELIRARAAGTPGDARARFDLRSVRYSGTVGGWSHRLHSRATGEHRGRAIRVILFARAALVGPLFAPAPRLVSLHRSGIDSRRRRCGDGETKLACSRPRGARRINARRVTKLRRKAGEGDLIR